MRCSALATAAAAATAACRVRRPATCSLAAAHHAASSSSPSGGGSSRSIGSHASSLLAPPARLQPRSVAAAAKVAERAASTRRQQQQQQFVQVEPDGSDAWRLDPVVEALKAGAVGIIPTDSNMAFVCDLGSKAAVAKLLEIKRARGSSKMSILCRSLQDVDTYTQGWPPSRSPGQPDMFKAVRRVLPGPYTFILLAGKELPKALSAPDKGGKAKKRHEVGVRLPGDPVAQAILAQLDRPLLCSTAAATATDDDGGAEVALGDDAATLMDRYGPQGLDFVVDAGPRRSQGSTVIDCTGAEPVVLRHGAGDTAWLEAFE